MATTIEKLATDFAAFQADFGVFVTNVQTALAELAAGTLSSAQQASVETIDSGLAAMDAAVKGITFPTPPAPPVG